MDWLANQTPESAQNKQRVEDEEFARVRDKRLVSKKIAQFHKDKESGYFREVSRGLTARDALAMLKHLLEPIRWSKNASVSIEDQLGSQEN